MFLNFLQTDEEKKVFIQMAVIVAISNVEEAEEEKNEEESSSTLLHSFGFFGKTKYEVSFTENDSWKMSTLENKIINGFMKELELSSYDVSTDKFNEIIEELSPVLEKLSRLTIEDRRLEVIEKLIEEGISCETIKDISPKSSRSIMIELLSVALVDDDYAPLEKVVINSIAKKLNIEDDEIEEMEDFINSMKKVYKSGLEIVNN
jgi:hypothetical protein